MFFKERQKEEMLCQGAYVVEKLLTSRLLKSDTLQLYNYKKDRQLWIKHDKYLRLSICHHCAFRSEDCDFYAEGLVDDNEPCGGFILLAYLKENNEFNDKDLMVVTHG
jgi:hypothetical protein